MWTSGRGSGSRSGRERDPERERPVWTDDARKRGTRGWTNRGMSSPASFNRRETEEYDRRSASFSSARSSYAGSSSSSGAGFLPVKRERSDDEEEPAPFAFVPMKEEPAPLSRRGVVGPEDYAAEWSGPRTTPRTSTPLLPPSLSGACARRRSVREEAERRRHAEELEALQWQQAVAANIAANEKVEEWRRIRTEQATKCIDLCS
ncbi:CDPK-related protein kinase [Hordeum vulgare]|nr:CDPK-related protein kinase [Hordeum vulgare]